MNQLEKTTTGDLSRLDTLAQEARIYAAGATMNMLQLGRVFIEAKTMLKHGEFATWCDMNAGCSIRTAENMMSAYTRFGNKPEFTQIGKSKLFKMLTLPAGTEDQFIADNDVSNMSSREVDQAIRNIRGAKEEVKDENKDDHTPIPDDKLVCELRTVREERDRLIQQNKDMIADRGRVHTELMNLRNGSEQDSILITEQQATIDSLTEELNRYRIAEARGEVGRKDHDMDAAEFRTAVHEFMGSVHQIPQMGKIFATMDNDERIIYDTLLKSVEAWTISARMALETIEGGFVS